jgi:AcrR family transcriptional regulator
MSMPRITDERREARREQVLEAARACLQEHGLEAVSMEMIIARSGLSTGAVYGYFKGKDELINAVVTEGTAAMGRRLVPILRRTPSRRRFPSSWSSCCGR